MTPISIDLQNLSQLICGDTLAECQKKIAEIHHQMEKGEGLGSEFLGWLHLPSKTSESLLEEISKEADRLRNLVDVVVCIGIGGSYLGAKAALTFCSHTFGNQISRYKRGGPEIYFAGHAISSDYLSDLIDAIGDRPFALNVISKSGTTTEPALAFRVLKQHLERRFGIDGAKQRIVVTTDSQRGALKELADSEGYPAFVIPDDVGGRFSVLTPVGLLPIAIAGISIKELMAGAREMEQLSTETADLLGNPAYRYAAVRHALYKQGKTLEVMSGFHPSLEFILEWWKQLAGESEGKEGKGIFPASVLFTTDLHSLGQWIQEGQRNLFETFMTIEKSNKDLKVPAFAGDGDGLSYLEGKSLDFINEKAYKGTVEAHLEGGVPNLTLQLRDRSPRTLGALFYFFQRAIAMSGYLLEVNPFDQPGVEFYKRNMFRLLGKPGYGKE
ncbi:MAG: glucose-6-phosphate isomerase [Candidatus Nitronauta litoralis]|uniref:Glucose-6-phosphate isomerase n=1 Tax=Candidatus Nitronauta litoralis TaxID=2705533 RepID=A0A7T0BY45_9BACT|nr:MAG: glucose-6-phosphate isomerase [Candidatus Nitronauta litoralis]